ncbi:MAG TPA: ParB/RepB/Spo0J family partition protein [Ramlibacter sp.]|jgi:ParB family chromosome partitioning protein|nr:ParB/RepB/Spo0J family partition protein [Ramlibacter sp.]
MTGTVFKRRTVSEERVAIAEATAAVAPIVGDPRVSAVTPLHSVVHAEGASSAPIYVLGQVYEVPLERIRSNPLNPRVVYTSQAVDEMAISLSTSGQRVAATGFTEGEGAVVLIEGETRLRGARAAGLKTLRVEIQPRPASDQELYKHARDANVRRREQTPLDDALKWKELLEKGVFASQADLASALELPESTVSRTLALASLPQRVVLGLADHPSLLNFQMLNALREYCRGFGEDNTIEYIPLVEKNGWGYRHVLADAAKADKGPVKRPRASSEAVAYAEGKGEIKLFDGGRRLELTLKGLQPEQAAELVGRLKELCASR